MLDFRDFLTPAPRHIASTMWPRSASRSTSRIRCSAASPLQRGAADARARIAQHVLPRGDSGGGSRVSAGYGVAT